MREARARLYFAALPFDDWRVAMLHLGHTGVRLGAGWAVLLVAALAQAQVARDGSQSSTTGAVQAHTWEHTIPAGGSNRYLVVGVSIEHGARAPSVETLTYAGLPMTALVAAERADVVRVELWGLANPPEGTAPIALRLTSPGGYVAGALGFRGVGSARAPAMTEGAGALASVTIASQPDEQVVGIYGSDGLLAPSAASGQAVPWCTRAMLVGCGASIPGAPNAVLSWSTTMDQPWAVAAIVLQPAPPAPDGGLSPDAADPFDGDGGLPPSDGGTGDGAPAGDAGPAKDAAPVPLDGARPDLPISGGGDGPVADGGVPAGDAGDVDAGIPPPRTVDLKAGCGCDMGGRTRGGPAWLLVGLVFFLRRRRR